MKFEIKNSEYNLLALVRRIGYKPLGYTADKELNCVRPLGRSYPRFHLYIKGSGGVYVFNLHLDQKKPSYEGATAHSGDYDGDIVEKEKERITRICRPNE